MTCPIFDAKRRVPPTLPFLCFSEIHLVAKYLIAVGQFLSPRLLSHDQLNQSAASACLLALRLFESTVKFQTINKYLWVSVELHGILDAMSTDKIFPIETGKSLLVEPFRKSWHHKKEFNKQSTHNAYHYIVNSEKERPQLMIFLEADDTAALLDPSLVFEMIYLNHGRG